MAVPAKEMHAYQARLATFHTTHQLSKRRASAQSKKKGGTTIEWPHERPAPEELARAGFFFRPAIDSTDNLQCFLCTVKLDGWEPTDDPIQEHIAHSRGCAWAMTISVNRHDDDGREPETRDPMSDEMLDARKATFTTGDGWPHEDKKGWRCKTNKMLEAGWAWDPAGEGEEGDGVTCFYCNLSLDGWEPKDDPFHEHKRRSPDCRFFQLLEHYHGEDAANGKMKKAKGRGKTSGRASTASKVSRASMQSAISTALSIPGSFEDELTDGTMAGVDDSVLTTATDVSRGTVTSTTKGKKKAGRPKAAAKGTKGKKKAIPEQEDDMEQQFADVSQSQGTQGSLIPSSQAPTEELPPPVPPKATKRGTRGSKQVEPSVIEISQIEAAAPKKATRGRKAKAEPQPEPESILAPETPDAAVIAQQRVSEVSAQLQDELEQSVDNFEPLDESTPAAQPPKRGVKRTSNGLKKQTEARSSVVKNEAIAPPKTKGKRGRPKKTSTLSEVENVEVLPEIYSTEDDPIVLDEPVVEIIPAPKKGKGRPKGKKAASTSSSRSSKATVTASEPEPLVEETEDLARDELEIEQELERIASEQSNQPPIQSEQEQTQEFEVSPSQGRVSKDSTELKQLQQEIKAEGENISQKDFASPPRRSRIPGGFSPSPAGSDKENQPSSQLQPSAKQARAPVVLSPTKTMRIPLAESTPNRSPAKALVSPSKQVSHLTSAVPWIAVDLDTVLLASPQPSPGKVGQQLVAAAGALTSPEKKMSVEEWVRYRATKGEEDLKRRCEQMVAAFEKEGMRGLETLNGINVIG